SDCPPDYTCSSAAVTSVGGASGRQCVPTSSDCADPGGGVCPDDSREDNDSREPALAGNFLGQGTHQLMSCPAASGIGDDEDWFKIDVAVDTQVTVEITGGESSDLDLALYTEAGALIDSSVSLSSMEEVSACLVPGRYLIRVYAWGAAENPYQLRLTRSTTSCAATCEVDESEQDDGPAQARATDLGAGPYSSTTQSICAGDDDWYLVELSSGDRLVADLIFEQTASDEDLDLHLYDADGATDLTPCSPDQVDTCDLANGQSGTSDEHFEWQAPASGCAPCVRYLVVRGFDGAENLYDISIRVE